MDKFLSLWYQTQLAFIRLVSAFCCDLLENFYLCGIKYNKIAFQAHGEVVVICLKISIFVVSNTTNNNYASTNPSCDLLENFYLCGIKHNWLANAHSAPAVVICLKISIFVVSNTTASLFSHQAASCDLLENFYLCGIKHNYPKEIHSYKLVVICLKISIFVVSNTTISLCIARQVLL